MIKFSNLLLEKIPNSVLKKILPKERIIMSPNNKIHFKNIKQLYKRNKPQGLWYSIGREWIDWVRQNYPEWEYDVIFAIELNFSKILVIKTVQDRKDFENKYGIWDEHFKCYFKIDWPTVGKLYSGIELLVPLGGEIGNWNKTWDIKSGCVWNKSGIKKIIKKG